jgi:hypothetical protein
MSDDESSAMGLRLEEKGLLATSWERASARHFRFRRARCAGLAHHAARGSRAALTRNGARNVTVLPFALSDAADHSSFMELPEDSCGLTPFLPEGSRLQLPTEELYPNAVCYEVEVRTLDELFDQFRF